MRYIVMTVPQTSMLPAASEFRLLALLIAGIKSLFHRHVYVLDTDKNTVIFSRIGKGRTTLVRVCCYERCPQPHRIYGCVTKAENARECSTCRLQKNRTYRNCALRRMAPHPAHATHGFCSACIEKVRQDFRAEMRSSCHRPADLVA